MLRRTNLVQTYGRHRQRVVNVDVWNSGDTNDNVFSSSDNSSLLDFKSPTVKTTTARQRRKGNGKENARERPPRKVRNKNEEVVPPVGRTGKRKAAQRCRPPLSDASNVSLHDSPATKQPQRRKKVVVDKSCQEPSPQFNFSELEKYSLIMSDSVEVEASCSDAGWKNTGSVTTSTPHVAPSRRVGSDSVVIPSSGLYRDSTSPLAMCRVELERLNVSDVSNITGGSSVDSYHGGSPSMDDRLRLPCSAEVGADASTSYDVSCDMFDDVPPSRRSMYLLRSQQKDMTTTNHNGVNNSLGGSMYSLSPVMNSSLVIVSSSESSDDEEALSSVESESYNESLSDIYEEEESPMPKTTHRQLTVSSGLSCVSPLGASRRSIKEALTPRKSCQTVSARDRVLYQCGQHDMCPFSECITPAMMKTITKIGEGVYGEVFRAQRRGQSVALKVIPIEGHFLVNDEPQKTFEEMLPEIVISKELSALRENEVNCTENFVQVHGVHVVEGSYPPTLLKQWDLFEKRKGSENDRPDKYTDTQLFIVFEFADSGADLESFQFNSMDEAHSVLVQVTTALAIAEAELQFEHRDLHWGNVLVARTEDETVSSCHKGTRVNTKSVGVKVSIIDFTLSRLSQDGCNIYTDLSVDPTLFTGEGDRQFDIYRLMREENSNDWMPHHPHTNVLWIDYLADKLLSKKKYAASKNRAEHQAALRKFRTFVRGALQYSSATALWKEKLSI